ncbi:hypothetical protein SUGI_0750070 [Cryptomeria japonica]|nr:hypothetical protein SUGI_0750070 [Cryptomeria japonica]
MFERLLGGKEGLATQKSVWPTSLRSTGRENCSKNPAGIFHIQLFLSVKHLRRESTVLLFLLKLLFAIGSHECHPSILT